MKRKKPLIIILLAVGAVLFALVAIIVVRSSRTVQAVVPATEIKAGTYVTNDMLVTIQVPVDTPRGYITDRSTLLGQKLKITAQQGQFLYMSDIMEDWSDILFGVEVPKDYVITALQFDDSHAVGGLITAGDTVDIMGVSNVEVKNVTNGSVLAGHVVVDPETDEVFYLDPMLDKIGDVAEHGFGHLGYQSYWVLANVKILETDSELSKENEGALSQITSSNGNSGGTFYIVALSPQDYQKLAVCSKYLDLYMNIAPAWNAFAEDDDQALLDLMMYTELQGLSNSQKNSMVEEYETENGEIYVRLTEAARKEIDARKKEHEDYIARRDAAIEKMGSSLVYQQMSGGGYTGGGGGSLLNGEIRDLVDQAFGH